MPLQLDRIAELDAALSAGALLLVPNYRGSDQLVDQLCLYRRRAQGGSVFVRPAIRAIDLWLRELWEQLTQLHDAACLGWRILEPAEEQVLWQQLIRKASPELLLLNRDGSATAAASAWRLLQQWQLPLEELRRNLELAGDPAHKDDREYAWAWLQAFDQHCQRQQLLSFSGMLQQLLHFAANGTLAELKLLPETLLLSGFDAPPPLYQSLFAALRAQGVSIDTWNFAPCQPRLLLQVCTVPADECRAAAHWASAVLQQDPAASIGILTADSEILKGELERCCAQIFTATPEVYGTTLSATLADAAFVHTALAALALLEDEINTLQCCALLRSPWLLAADSEQDARAELELRLRKSQALQIRTADLRQLCQQQGKPWHCPELGASLLALQQRLLRQSRQQTLQGWLSFFEGCWDALLPRSTLLQSGNRALVKAWEGLLKQVQMSSTLFGKQDFAEACALVGSLCRASTLAAGSTQAPVQLLTPVTAADMHFTHLWCMQMTAGLWPGEQQPHPYLPLTLQQQHGLPGADRNEHLRQSRELLQGLMQRTTHELVFSHANSAEDLPQRATALLPAGLQQGPLHQQMLPGGLHPALATLAYPALEILQDSTLVPFPDDSPVQGGSGLLTSQSACPFKSFAQYRLQARELPQPAYGIPAHALGACVHAALQAFWSGMQSQAALLASAQATIEQAINAALTPALNALARQYPTVLTPRLQALEAQRLSALLLHWLDVERARGPFTVIATEQELLWALPRLQLSLRLDRIDRHADGSTVIVDYKSGKSLTTRWEEERPAAPQLLLYLLAVDAGGKHPQTSALLYAHVNVEDLGYDGIAADDSVFPGLAFSEDRTIAQPDWQSLKQRWRQLIGVLADELLQGYAAVQPTRRDSCNYCHLGSLCRIAELGAERRDEA
jgi:probable DNA repair protein